MKLYVAGPMTGIEQHNFPAFFAAADKLRAAGHDVINPAEVDQGENPTWDWCLRNDIPLLVTCEGIALLPGWEKSRGAKLEKHIADALCMHVIYVDHFAAREPAHA